MVLVCCYLLNRRLYFYIKILRKLRINNCATKYEVFTVDVYNFRFTKQYCKRFYSYLYSVQEKCDYWFEVFQIEFDAWFKMHQNE
jgi:hypothetical protein